MIILKQIAAEHIFSLPRDLYQTDWQPSVQLVICSLGLNSLFANCSCTKITRADRLCCIDYILSAGCTDSLRCARHLPGVSTRTQTHPHPHAATLNAFIDLSSNLVTTLTFGAHGNQPGLECFDSPVQQIQLRVALLRASLLLPLPLFNYIYLRDYESYLPLTALFENGVDTGKPIGMSWRWPESVFPLITMSTGTLSKCSVF